MERVSEFREKITKISKMLRICINLIHHSGILHHCNFMIEEKYQRVTDMTHVVIFGGLAVKLLLIMLNSEF